MQLSFAVVPLIQFTGNAGIMGEFVNSLLIRITGWVLAFVIMALNLWLLIVEFRNGL